MIAAAFFSGCTKPTTPDLPSTSLQALVVSAISSSGSTGSLSLYERGNKSDSWRRLGAPIPVALGRSGLAPADEKNVSSPSRVKKEGDGMTPLGTFPIVSAFGRAATFSTRLPYRAISPSTEAVDDPGSRYYNRIVDRNDVVNPDWQSSEHMFRNDFLYDLGLVVGYNSDPVQLGKGSCIFLHIWRAPGSPTSGCIAMARPDLERIVRWLDPAARPVIAIQISQSL